MPSAPLSDKPARRVRPLPREFVHRDAKRTWEGPLLDRPGRKKPASAVSAQETEPYARQHRASPWQVLRVLCRSDFRARYRAQALGAIWSLLNPLVMMGIMSLVFTQVFRTTTRFFPIFLLIGLIVWQWVVSSVNTATQVFVSNAEVIKRTVFLRQLMPISVVLSYGLNFCIECLALLVFIPIFPGAFRFSPALLLVPVLLALLVILLCGVVLATSVLNVIYRDVAYIVNTALLLLYWLTPVFYPMEVIPMPYRMILQCNPIAGVIVNLRLVVMQGQVPSLLAFGELIISTFLFFGLGWLIFRHYERMVLDHV